MSKTGAKLTLVSLSVFAVGVLIFMLYRKKRQMETESATGNDTKDNSMNGYYTDPDSLAAINHNPTNLTDDGSKWVGRVATPQRLIDENRSRRFVAFENDYYGLRAAVINLKNGYFAKGYNTPAKIIEKWAPRNENNTDGYIKYVADSMKIDKNATIDPKDKEQMFLLLRAICIKDGGFLGDRLIKKAVEENI